MGSFHPDEAVMKFLDKACDQESGEIFLFRKVWYTLPDMRDLINEESQLGKRIYDQVVLELYYASLPSRRAL